MALDDSSSAARSHYSEPLYYDRCYADRNQDIAFYKRLASSAQDVLEYGCGSGRIAIPIARGGARVVGVDDSTPMLQRLEGKLQNEPQEVRERLTIVAGDMRNKKLEQRFDLVICAFNTFLHLYERRDAEGFLARVREHLKPGGVFAFDVSVPAPVELARDPRRPYRVPRLRHPDSGLVVRYAEYFDYDPMTQLLRVTMRFEPVDKAKSPWSVLLSHRQYYPQEIEALLHYNGFVVDSVHPDFRGAEGDVGDAKGDVGDAEERLYSPGTPDDPDSPNHRNDRTDHSKRSEPVEFPDFIAWVARTAGTAESRVRKGSGSAG